LRKVTLATKDSIEGKLAPSWKGPYKVISCQRPGAYYLEDFAGKVLPRPCNFFIYSYALIIFISASINSIKTFSKFIFISF
jgi:hypothetical protein